MVAREIPISCVCCRCQRIESAPASSPCPSSRARIVVTSSTRAGLVAFGFETGRREWGSHAASPSAR